MSEPGAVVRRVFIEGYVQGVGYRYFARRVALNHFTRREDGEARR